MTDVTELVVPTLGTLLAALQEIVAKNPAASEWTWEGTGNNHLFLKGPGGYHGVCHIIMRRTALQRLNKGDNMIVTVQLTDEVRIDCVDRNIAAPAHVWLAWKDERAELLKSLKEVINYFSEPDIAGYIAQGFAAGGPDEVNALIDAAIAAITKAERGVTP